ncbi:IS110 family transposase [Variovorax sp. E3]|uniref:IS110 family transposase n=1 Tax=Variovorax sp. E3 TaxID=1914993 RepID=UPI0022B6389D|nr:IS110 family transposase [Variovorax sp. E3]
MQSIANLPVIGLDLAKSVFQLHIVDADTGEIQWRQIKRARLTEFFTKCVPSLVAMEACGASHHWAGTIRQPGLEVRLLPAQHVKAFLLRDKTDAMDAQAIWVAAQQPHIHCVPVKTERQQACMALHGMRRQLMKMRIMQTNALRGILAEFGVASRSLPTRTHARGGPNARRTANRPGREGSARLSGCRRAAARGLLKSADGRDLRSCRGTGRGIAKGTS